MLVVMQSGFIRVREFTIAEIEHFCNPTVKKHPKFNSVATTGLLLYSASNQMDGKSAEKRTVGETVTERLIENETLGYFIARIQAFLLRCGVDPTRLRFRHHMANEMAHYAQDCWDAETLTSFLVPCLDLI